VGVCDCGPWVDDVGRRMPGCHVLIYGRGMLVGSGNQGCGRGVHVEVSTEDVANSRDS